MSKEDKPPPSPKHGLFDPSHLLAPPGLGLAGLPFPHLGHLPAFPFLARPPFPPALFGGLGALPSPLLAHGLPPTTGGADWWRAASEHARRMAGSSGIDFFAGSLGPQLSPAYAAALGLDTAPAAAGLEFLLTAPSDLDKTSSIFNMAKYLNDLPSTSSASPAKRSRTSTPSPAHQKSGKSSSSASSAASSSKDSCFTFSPPTSDIKHSWHVNGSTYNFKSSVPHASGAKRRRHRTGKVSDGASALSTLSAASGSAGNISDSAEPVALNLTKTKSCSDKVTPTSTETSGVQDLSLKKVLKQSKKTENGTNVTDSDSPDVSSPGSDISDDSHDNNTTDGEMGEKGDDKRPGHQIDDTKKRLMADQIRQQLMAGMSDSPPAPAHSTPLVVPSLRLRLTKQKGQKSSPQNAHYSLLNLPQDHHSNSSAREGESHGIPPPPPPSLLVSPFPYISAEQFLNHQSRDDSQDSLPSFQTSEADDSKFGGTSGSERLLDSESQSGWGSEEDGSHLAGTSSSPGPYRVHEVSDDSGKRRNIVLNEKELIIPLEHGWRRQTTIHGMGRRGIVGEVLYFAPCSKKMKTIPDVMRYLDRHGITDLTRENFTFNTKVNIGQFYEIRDKQVVALTEVEILDRIAMSKGKRARMQMLARKKRDKQLRQQALAKQVMEAKLKKRLEQQDMARKAAEMKFQMRLEKEQQKEMAKKLKEVRLIERQKEKEQSRIIKQQEKMRQQEQIRIEREMRAQQIIESNLLWLQMEREREMKKQQQIIMKEQEKERRRQHLLLVKALEQRKKQEEKQAQRQMELFIAREMKKPMDDMELRDGKTLPSFPRCPEAKVAGPAFSDCLMIVEFIHNFADALGLDSESLPTLDVLQNGLLNSNDEDVEEVVTLYLHLLRFALDDIGVPNPREAMTMLNQKITDLEINDATMSEVTRLFLKARGEKRMSEWLEDIPLEALNPTKKAAIIAFLCNELLSSKVLSGEIDKTLETINTLRRDKWIVEGKLRKLRTIRAKKYLRIEHLHQNSQPTAEEDSMTNTTSVSSKIASDFEDEKEEEEDDNKEEEDEEDHGDECDMAHTTGNGSEDEDEGLSKEEMDKKIEKLMKQHNTFDSKVADVCKQLRGTCLGQDRYKRFYWILPKTGGLFVEGIESGETEALQFEADLLAKQKANELNVEVKEEKIKIKEEKEEFQNEVATNTETVLVSDKVPLTDMVEKADKLENSLDNQMVKLEGESLLTAKSDHDPITSEMITEHVDPVQSHLSEEKCTVNNSEFKVPITPATTDTLKTAIDVPSGNSLKLDDTEVIEFNSKDLKIGWSLNHDGDSGSKIGEDNSGVKNDISSVSVEGSCQKINPSIVSDPDTSQAAELSPAVAGDGEKTDLVHGQNKKPSSLLFQEPFLTKLTGLFKLPNIPTSTGKVQPVDENDSLNSSVISSSALASTLSTLSVPAITTSAVSLMSAITMTTSSITMSKPKVVQTLSSTANTMFSSMPQPTPSVLPASETLLATTKLLPPSTITQLTAVTSSSPVVSLLNKSPTLVSSPSKFIPAFSFSTSSPLITSSPSKSSSSPPPHTRKMISSTSATILSSTPVSLLPSLPSSLVPSDIGRVASTSLSLLASATLSSLMSPSTTSSMPSTVSSSATTVSSPAVLSPFSLSTISLLCSTPVTSPVTSSSPLKGDKKSNFASIDALLKKEPDTAVTTTITSSSVTSVASANHIIPSSNHFLPLSLFPPSPLISEHFSKSYADILDQKPWFSILPRMPCDEASLTRASLGGIGTTNGNSHISIVTPDNIASTSLSLLSLLPMHALQQAQQAQAQTSAAQKHSSSTHSIIQQSQILPQSVLEVSNSSFQTHLSQSSITDTSQSGCAVGDISLLSTPGTDFFKVPAPPGDSALGEPLTDIDPFAILQKVQGECKPIPLSRQRGWWKVSDAKHVRELHSCLLNRGVREKNMSYMLRKHMEFICTQLCTHDSGKTPNIKMEKSDNKPEEKAELVKQEVDEKTDEDSLRSVVDVDTKWVKVKAEKTEVSDNKDSSVDLDDEKDTAILADAEDSWNSRVRYEVELACLEDVEALEDRVFNASLQNKQGWKLPQRTVEDPDIELVQRSVTVLGPQQRYPMDVARERLLMLESNIERRYLKPPLIRNVQLNMANISAHNDSKSSEMDGEGAAGREEQSEHNEDVPPGLLLWRRAVVNAKTPAQLNLCTQLLANSVAWEKSIMKVTCQICMKDDNEAELLLCDGCDKGYHTYCFKPKMETIPDGDWYCYECVSKASGVSHCIVCGEKTGKIVECDKCPRAIHTDCLDPPLPRMPKKWKCATCQAAKNKKASKRKRKESTSIATSTTVGRDRKDSTASSTRERKDSEATSEAPPPEKKKKESTKEKKDKHKEDKKKEEKVKEKAKEKKEKKEKVPKEKKPPKDKKKEKEKEKPVKEDDPVIDTTNLDGDMLLCGKLLTELETSDNGWPFLKPVNTKQFPSYKKYIKQPMDFYTMRIKLRDNVYKTRYDFAADLKLILNNCETFNEDDSEVGQAGHNLRKIFTQRWHDIFTEDS